ncbi:uncharacterized protein [Solanum tuberosum]|uniref:uncharacterized protein n=1 Tax=Solanum tuberosum TaxID=4113 RepID=UPI000739F8FC|nr:PREDICTED: uncharacterized protein LOC107060230 [Solanum tuberosum]
MIEDTLEVFVEDFSVVGNNFDECLLNHSKTLEICEEENLVLNWENYHFMVKEGILVHKVSEKGLEVDREKIEVIDKLVTPISVNNIRSSLGDTGFYQCFIKDFLKIAHPLCKLLEKEIKFTFDEACTKAFEFLKEKLILVQVIIAPDRSESFEVMCDASGVALGGCARAEAQHPSVDILCKKRI